MNDLGLNISTTINMFLTQIVKRNGLPFEVVNPKPNKEMLEALSEILEMVNNPQKYPRYKSRKDLKKALLSDNELYIWGSIFCKIEKVYKEQTIS